MATWADAIDKIDLSKNVKPAKINVPAKIINGACKGMEGIVVRAERHNGKIYVGIEIDEYTVIETTSDNIEQN